jgi:hypothetical protein
MTSPAAEPVPLKLLALDPEDLTILSAHLQDAVVRVGDIVWRPTEKRFALVARRYDWEGAEQGVKRRRLAGFQLSRVGAVQARGVEPGRPETVLNLLGVTFEPSSGAEGEPAGHVHLAFSGGASFRLSVECIEAQLKDLGGMWETAHQPSHP